MFSNQAQRLVDQAKDVGVSLGDTHLTLKAITTVLLMDLHSVRFLSEALGVQESELRRRLPPPHPLRRCHGKLPLSPDVREMLVLAKTLVAKIPAANQPALISVPHLVCAVALSGGSYLGEVEPPDEPRALTLLANWIEESAQPPSLGDVTRRLRSLRNELRNRIYGQEQAIQQLIDGLFNVEVVAATDTDRRKPRGLFVFAGPPGVGKTYLAELAASHLDRPFMRFDMSAYGHSHEAVGLTGSPPMYHGAKRGALTEFVQRNPNALLLFDEIEKAHLAAIQLFLQVLDGGRLQDKFTEQDVEFRDTIIIFTTNVGRALYENPNTAGVYQANAPFHRNTILDALRTEIDPRTREPFFPGALCSRLATGHPVLFNHLRAEDLARVAEAELNRVSGLLQRQHGQRYEVDGEIPLAIVMREGARTDARTVKAQAEAFLKNEVFKTCQLFADERVEAAARAIEQVLVTVDEEHAGDAADRLFGRQERPAVLFVGDPLIGNFYSEAIPEITWHAAHSSEQAFDLLARETVNFLLLDLAMQPLTPREHDGLPTAFHDVSAPVAQDKTLAPFDHRPLAARRFAAGQQLLEQLHIRMPEIPVYLFSLEDAASDILRNSLDDELFLACVRAGGARGAVRTSLAGGGAKQWEDKRDQLRDDLEAIAKRLQRERLADELARQSNVVTFDTAPTLSADGRQLTVRCRNFRTVRTIRSSDVGAIVSDVERPTTTFADVIGAAGAKEALTFIGQWLRDPKRYAAAGVDPPRGVLLTGRPGTGKTMLARALAGESECAFLAESATNFVTIWQGSGPQNMRDLFARARRYAPSVVFIDEIDAIGKTRVGTVGAGRAQEETLNALLVEMDGFSRSASVIVLAATNHPELLDPALKRRFNREIEVELPTRAERTLYLSRRLQSKAKHEVSAEMLNRIAAQSAGLSIADLERILNQAAVMAFGNSGVITDAILGEAFEKVTMGEAKAGTDPLRTARHEAGHALLMCLTGKPPIYVTTVGRGSFGGYAAFEDRDERRSQTKPELEDLICQMLGGREAERLYYGDGLGESSGPSSDLAKATQQAEAMVYELGMAPEVGFVRVDRGLPRSEDLAQRCDAAVRRTIEDQSERTRELLSKHRETLDRIVAALMERNRLLQEELLALLSPEERGSAGKEVA